MPPKEIYIGLNKDLVTVFIHGAHQVGAATMNKRLTTVERSLDAPPVTKRQRLQRFANVITSGPPVPLHLFINLEYRDAGEWDYLAHPSSAFAFAAKDSLLQDAGLTGDGVGDAHRLCVPKTLSELMTWSNHLSWRNDRAALFRSGAVLTSPFKSKLRLEAENTVLRHYCDGGCMARSSSRTMIAGYR